MDYLNSVFEALGIAIIMILKSTRPLGTTLRSSSLVYNFMSEFVRMAVRI